MPPRVVDLPLTKPLKTLVLRYERAVELTRRAQALQREAEERFAQAQAEIRLKDKKLEQYRDLELQIEHLKHMVRNGPVTITTLNDPNVPQLGNWPH